NTPDDEVFPFISDSGKLFFCSNGHLGLGGQDIFWTEDGHDGLWVLPRNLGTPFNSQSDDFAIIFNATEKEGYFTSNRSGGAGKDDIYFFRLAETGTPVQLDVVDLTTGAPIPYIRVLSSCGGDTLVSDAEGRLFFSLPDCCTLTGTAKGYQPRSLEACERKGELAADTLFLALALADRIRILQRDRVAAEEQARRNLEIRSEELERLVVERTAEIKTLHGILPICANCKKIRDDEGAWQGLEEYISHHTDAEFSHGICADCMTELYPGLRRKPHSAATA
ncbi:MAG: hypothetical protein KDE53_21070, partial [Caldilineaceae bacterium]|nr:hypothetical protein [Caldilineaceae bacterium]